MVMAQWNKAPMENALWLQWNMSQWLTDPVKKAMFCERVFFFEGVIVMLKDKKYSLAGTMSIKTSSIHYMK